MANLDTFKAWNSIWDRVSTIVGGSFNVESPFGALPSVIDAPTTLYVETTGNDKNSGTQSSPFRTIQAAINYVTKFRLAAVTQIQVGIGNFTGFVIPPIELISGASGLLAINGTSVTTGISGTGSVAAGTTNAVLTDGTKSWTVNEHVGSLVRYSTNSGSTWSWSPVISNTATTLTLPLSQSGTFLYEIYTYGTVIDTAVTYLGDSFAAGAENLLTSSSTSCVAVMGPNAGQGQTAQIVLRQLKLLASSTATCLITRSSGTVQIDSCWLGRSSGTANVFTNVGNGCVSILFRSYLMGAVAHSTFASAPATTMTGCVLNGGGTTATAISLTYGQLALASCAISNYTTSGITFAQGAFATLISNCSFTSCVTGISLSRAHINLSACTFSSLTTGISAVGRSNVLWTGTLSTFTSCTNGALATTGSIIQIPSSTTFTTVTNELSVDGTASTVAAMRALTPKVFPGTPNAYGSYVYE